MAVTDRQIREVMNANGIIGSSPALINAVRRALIIAPTDSSVLINGENGTGKEAFPKIIHAGSPRKHKKYIAVNCGAIPSGTISSELFGHERGSFTGADNEHKGYFEEADKGTIFLDEVADLTLDAQARLLRVLESGEYIRVGSAQVRKTDVRVVAATNKDLLQMVKEGKFREDLFYRIASIRIEVPPLRERGEDIKLLATHFSYIYAAEQHHDPITMDESAYHELMTFHWGGNVRELQSLIREMSTFETGVVTGRVVKHYLQQYNHSGNLPVAYDNVQHDYTQEREVVFKIILQMQQEIKEIKEFINSGGMAQQGNRIHLSTNVNELHRPSAEIGMLLSDNDEVTDIEQHDTWHNSTADVNIAGGNTSHHPYNHVHATVVDVEEDGTRTLQETERAVITGALERNNGRRKQTATELGISERTLYRKIKEYGLEHRNNRK